MIWTYILTGVTFVTSLAMLGILISSLVELGRISSKRKSKKEEEMKKEHEDTKKRITRLEKMIRDYDEALRTQQYLRYVRKCHGIPEDPGEWDINNMTKENKK